MYVATKIHTCVPKLNNYIICTYAYTKLRMYAHIRKYQPAQELASLKYPL